MRGKKEKKNLTLGKIPVLEWTTQMRPVESLALVAAVAAGQSVAALGAVLGIPEQALCPR